jgi:hypothetical protein
MGGPDLSVITAAFDYFSAATAAILLVGLAYIIVEAVWFGVLRIIEAVRGL